MFYHYFRVFNWICTIFGLRRPFLSSTGIPLKITRWHKLWSLFILLSITISYVITINVTLHISIMRNLEKISNVNELFVNFFVFLLNLVKGERVCTEIYNIVNSILCTFQFSNRCLKMISVKFYFWFSVPALIFIIFTALEIWHVEPPYVFAIRIPVFLSIFHLIFHLCLVLALLKVLNYKMAEMFNLNCKAFESYTEQQNSNTTALRYMVSLDVNFIDVRKQNSHLDLKSLCKIYDDINTSVQLLGKYHGKQILLTIWLMFSSAVISTALIACNEANVPWLVISRSAMPYYWCFIGCYIDDQIRQEVERTDMLIIKYLIDFRCDPGRRNTLQMFKQLVSTNRLQFTACNLFHLNYAMILGTILNVITYSIILVQLFLSEG